MDEMIDNGMIMESDAQQVIGRVAIRSDDIPLGEQTVAQVLQSAKRGARRRACGRHHGHPRSSARRAEPLRLSCGGVGDQTDS